MKKIDNILIGALALALSASFSACQKDFLDRKPLTEISELDVWTDPNLTKAFVARMYEEMDHGFAEVMISSLTDESRFIHDYNTSRVLQGNISPDEHGAVWDFANWGKFYGVIRNTNMYFENIDEVPFTDENDKQQLTGEVHFMRAYNYFMLLRMYGGVPLITETFGLDDEEAIQSVSRNSYEETVNFIVAECDKAIEMTNDETTRGVVNKSAARALKSRVLLYAASDLYNKPGNSNELVGYTSGSQVERWRAAKDAAYDIIETNLYSLYNKSEDPTENYTNIFLDKTSEETIFAKLFDRELLGTSHDLYNGPNGYNNWGGNVPLQNMVDVYQMNDGSPFSWTNNAHKIAPYENRDPRFAATILYNGAPWKQRGDNGIGLDPVGVIQTAQYEYWNGSSVQTRWGLDTRNSPIESWNGTYSGYYLRKFMDITLNAQFIRGDQDWIFFRYAEVLLNYAEACIELGEEAEAKKYLKMVRERAGMPGSSVDNASGQALENLYRYERRVELAYEGHRFFDARRWMTAKEDFSKPAQGIVIYGKLQPDRKTLVYSYTVDNIQDRSFPEKMYFIPIPIGEIRKNENIEQNPNY
ncbi:RagB/SusD family nutrient uptake outer membrane protein [Albibacterium indicum]|uniref:RagB/SusD family nutrient uptake outer membrane protein n=1 Tax=Albibacterium indicum TaxID=2292082 RepID=UPI000E49914B|nr:RagB/SusD family nutrient uptake outer membrane protein [Pedobacter indicus]